VVQVTRGILIILTISIPLQVTAQASKRAAPYGAKLGFMGRKGPLQESDHAFHYTLYVLIMFGFHGRVLFCFNGGAVVCC